MSARRSDRLSQSNHQVEKVLDKKIFRNKKYYKLKWTNSSDPTWEPENRCNCDKLIAEYEKLVAKQSHDEEEDEWEVEEILDKRIRNNAQVEYLVRWKNWSGPPTWVEEEKCECVNLIAAFENPKLKKLWNFQGSNTRLWLDKKYILRYMRRFATKYNYKINVLEFEDDLPLDEKSKELEVGLNIGPLRYLNHWYLVLIIVNYITVTRQTLIADPSNTLIGVNNTRVHPVFMRLKNLYPNIPVKPIAMTPMERSDVCAYYVLAAFERAMFLFRKEAKFLVSRIFFDPSRAEIIRSNIRPQSDGEISVSLPVSGDYLGGPKCEFCCKMFDSTRLVDNHIRCEHFQKDLKKSPTT